MMKYAVIDIGSNSVRCVIFAYDEQNHRLKKLENLREYPQLLHYVNEKKLTKQGIDVLAQALIKFKKVIESLGVETVFCVATAALRAAENQEEIITRIFEKTTIKIEIISPEMEAYYGLMAMRLEEPSLKDAVLVDMGGGSTEISLVRQQKIVQMKSFPYGVVNLSDRYFAKNDDVDYAADLLKYQIFQWQEQIDYAVDSKLPLVLIGGSARNCAKIYRHLSEQKYVSKKIHMLTQRDMYHIYNFAIHAKRLDFTKVPRFTIERQKTIKPAAVLFRMLSKFVDAPVVFISNHGVREGVVYDYLEKNQLL
ncbi:MAG: hypothetical protein ACRC3J_03235 [Culicoidibacterales bacterium]